MSTPRSLRGWIAAPAYPFSAVLLGLAAIAGWWPGAWLGVPLALLALANLAFFRNPPRTASGAGILSPADGRVVEIAEVEDPDGYVEGATRIAIFLSVLNVHVNRAPLGAKVRGVRRSGNAFRAAFRAEASTHNVQSRMDLETADGQRFGVVQITGWIARRILCYAREGDELERGAPYGLICYGSRMEVYVPAPVRVAVRVGDVVRAGETVIAEARS